MVNVKAIKIRMIELDVTYDDIARALGRKRNTVRCKLYGYRPLFLHEAEIIQKILKIPDDEFRYYFFDGESRSVTNDD